MRRWLAGGLAAVALIALTACSGNSAERTVTVTSTAPVATAPASTEAESRYPIEIPISGVPETMRRAVTDAGARSDVAVLLAPGIYASRGNGDLGEVEDYISVYGLYIDVKQFERELGYTVGSTCW